MKTLGILVLMAASARAQGPQMGIALDSSNPNPLTLSAPVLLDVQVTAKPLEASVQFSLTLPNGATATAVLYGGATVGNAKAISCFTNSANIFSCIVTGPNASTIGGLTFAQVSITFQTSGTFLLAVQNPVLASPAGDLIAVSASPPLSIVIPGAPPPPPPPIAVVISPVAASLAPLQTQQFVVTVSNADNSAVTWGINPSIGSISATGLYTAPAAITTIETVILTATSVVDNTKSASGAVTLNPPVTSPCDLNGDGVTDATDLTLAENQAIGKSSCTNGDLDGNKVCNAVDVQRVANAVAGGPCRVGQ